MSYPPSNQPPSDPYGQGYGQSPYGQPSSGSPYGQPTPGSPYAPPTPGSPYAQPQGGQPYGQNPYGQPYGQNPYGQSPYGQPYVYGQPYAQAPKRRSALFFILLIPGLLLCAIVGIGVLTLLGGKVSEPQTIVASDGQSQVTVLGTWSKMDLNDEAEIEVGSGFNEQYMVVLTESKEDFDLEEIDLETYTDFIIEGMRENVKGAQVGKKTPLTIHGRSALQHEITGSIDGIKLTYWVTTVDGTDNFFHIVTWTLASQANKNREVLNEATRSFKEILK